MWVLDDAQIPNQIWSGGNAIEQHSFLPTEQAVPSAPLAELETQVLLLVILPNAHQHKATLYAYTVADNTLCL